MDLLEYQAKSLFVEVGIPVLPSQKLNAAADLRTLKIPYPVVLKSQVRAGGRGKVGGVRFVENTIDAVAAAQAIFSLPIAGEYPNAILAETKYGVDREIYLAIAIDRNARRLVLFGSSEGGSDLPPDPERFHRVVVSEGFSPFYARHLVLAMGLRGSLVPSVSDILEKMCLLVVRKDLDFIEIDPLGVSASGELMALDGKVSVSDSAIGRHPEFLAWFHRQHSDWRSCGPRQGDRPGPIPIHPLGSEGNSPTAITFGVPDPHLPSELTAPLLNAESAPLGAIEFPVLPDCQAMHLGGNIAAIANGWGLTLAVADTICQQGGRPAGLFDLGWNLNGTWKVDPVQCLGRLLERLRDRALGVDVILLSLMGSALPDRPLAAVLETYLRHCGVFLPDSPVVQSAKKPNLVRGDRARSTPRNPGSRPRATLLERPKLVPQLIVYAVGTSLPEVDRVLAQGGLSRFNDLNLAVAASVGDVTSEP